MNPSDMTNEQLRVAVAEALGWTDIRPIDPALCDVQDIGKGIEGRTKLSRDRFADYFCPVPDFPEDLNACHEFESGLRVEVVFDYMVQLVKICALDMYKPDCGALFVIAHATARQRCIALLETLKKEKP